MRILGIILTLGSFGCFIGGLVYFFRKSKDRKFTKRLIFLTVFVLFAILLLQLCNIILSGEGLPTLLIDTMQVFSLDFDYGSAIDPGELFTSSFLNGLVKAYRILIYTVAPVIGGALLFDVLAGISPDLRLLSAGKRKFYIFSQMNEKALTLAESIMEKSEVMEDPVIIFTDCNSDSESETYQEMLMRAGQLKAICMPENILSYSGFHRSERCTFFLLNTREDGEFDETVNLSRFKGLLSEENVSFIADKGAGIFVFTNDAITVENIRVIKLDYDKTHQNTEKISLHVIRDNAQTANSLMKGCPPYETLDIHGNDTLNVLIMGNNSLSREFFRTVFWNCQLLNHPLRIAVAGDVDENGRSFRNWLNSLNRELIESCTVNSECLRINEKGDHSAPYAALAFIDADLNTLDMESFLNEERYYDCGCDETFSLKQFNYFIVASGNDELNNILADRIRKTVSYLNFDEVSGKRKDIVAIIEDNDLSEILSLRYQQWNREHQNMRMLNYGSMKQRFSVETVYSDRIYLASETRNNNISIADHSLPNFDSTKDDIYNEWANIARAYHLASKMFSAGHPITPADPENVPDDFYLNQKVDYVRAVSSDAQLFYDLSWLEHRRWNAFIRAQGFRQPPELLKNYDILERCIAEYGTGDPERLLPIVEKVITLRHSYGYKDIPNQYHPCLVECLMNDGTAGRDYLDLQSKMRELIDVAEKKEKRSSGKMADVRKHRRVHPLPGGIKNYDCPDADNYPLMTPEEVYEYLFEKKPADSDHYWNQVRKAYPEIDQCADRIQKDRYYTDMVIDYKAEQ